LDNQPISKAGNAIIWQALQYGGDKVIFLLRLVILAKLLTPDDFGLVAIAGVAIDVLMRVSNFGMIPALIQREDTEKEHYDAAWTIGVARALAITIIIFLSADLIANFFVEPRAVNIIRALSLRPLIDAASSMKVANFTRKLDFRSLALIQLPKAVTNTIVSIFLAKSFGAWALVFGALVGQIVYLVISYISAPYRPRISFQIPAIKSLAQFGRWIFWTSIVAMAGQTILRLVISRQLGTAELGLYYLATSLAFLPADVASQIVGEVSFPFYARIQANIQQITTAFQSILTSLAVLLIPSSALLIVLTPSIVESVLGPQWEGTTSIIRVLAFANIIGLLGETVGPILRGVGRPDKEFLISAVQYSLLVVFVWGLARPYGVVGAAFAWLPAILASQIANFIFIRQILPRPFAGLRLSLLSIAVVSAMAGVIAFGANKLVNGFPGLIIAGLLGVSISGSMFWVLERRFAVGLSDGLVRAFPQIAVWIGLGRG